MLTLEAVCTALLARWLYSETLGRRLGAGMLLLTSSGYALVLGQIRVGTSQNVGLMAETLVPLLGRGQHALAGTGRARSGAHGQQRHRQRKV